MKDVDKRDWILPGVALVLLFVGFGLLRLVDFGPPQGWNGEQGPFPFKRMERDLLQQKAERARANLPPPSEAQPEVELQGGPLLRWSADGTMLAGLSLDGAPALARFEADAPVVFAIPGLSSAPYHLAWQAQGLLLLSAPRSDTGGAPVLMATAWTRRGAMAPKSLLPSDRLPGAQLDPEPVLEGQSVVLISRATAQDSLVLWRRDTDEVLTLATGAELADPVVSPDGATVAYSQRSLDDWDVLQVPLVGGEPQPVASGPGDQHLPVWAADGTLAWWDQGTLRSTAALELVGAAELQPASVGPWLATLRASSLVLVHPDGTELQEHPLPEEAVGFDLVEHGPGHRLAWASSSGGVTVQEIQP